jgi:LmbE family N-acetylglucosaminyl deacetylase
VLGLFPHPDDEAYAAGGLLAYCAAGGAAVEIVCATRGERGSDRTGTAAPGNALAALRTRELEASCRALGIAPPEFLDLPDAQLDTCRARAVALLSRHIAQHQPHLIVTLGTDGVYGNLDHLAWTAIVTAAVQSLAQPPRVLHTVFPRRLFAPVWRALRRRRGDPLVGAIDPNQLGADDADLRLDIRALRQRKLAAVAAHRSQLVGGDPLTFLLPNLIEPLLDEEWYAVAHGPPLPVGAVDPFEAL